MISRIFLALLMGASSFAPSAMAQNTANPTYGSVTVGADPANGNQVVRRSYLDTWLNSIVGFGLAVTGGKLNALSFVAPYFGSHTVTSTDMGGTLALTGSGTLTIPAISTSVFAAGMSFCYANTGAGTWTISTTPTIAGLASTTIAPNGFGCLVSNGTSLVASATAGGVTGVTSLGTGVTAPGGVLTVAGASGPLAAVTTLGTNLSITSGTLNAAGGGGGGTVYPSEPRYRLTGTSGSCFPTADQTAIATLYWTPCGPSNITLYSGVAWTVLTPGESSLSLSGVASGSLYDVFAYSNAGTATLELSAAWASGTARTDALGMQDGVTVKSSDHTRLWLGTIRGSASGQTADAGGGVTSQVGGQRFVWNQYNRRRTTMFVYEGTGSWQATGGTSTWRGFNGATGTNNCTQWVQGDASAPVQASFSATAYSSNDNTVPAYIGIGINGGTTPSGSRAGFYNNASTAAEGPVAANYVWPIASVAYVNPTVVGLGTNTACMLEKAGTGTSYFLGTNGSDGAQSGMFVYLN